MPQQGFRAWIRRRRRRILGDASGLPRRCAECGREVQGGGPDPSVCPYCGVVWRSA